MSSHETNPNRIETRFCFGCNTEVPVTLFKKDRDGKFCDGCMFKKSGF